MSLSKEERMANVNDALDRFVTDIANAPIRAYILDRNKSEYSFIYPTTWTELTDTYQYVRQAITFTSYFHLTPHGWKTCLERGGLDKDESIKKLIGKLCRHLKNSVKGRHEELVLNINDVAKETKLQPGLISNILEARLIEYWLNRHGAKLHPQLPEALLIVPTNFGLERL
jgi:hypothetical protein